MHNIYVYICINILCIYRYIILQLRYILKAAAGYCADAARMAIIEDLQVQLHQLQHPERPPALAEKRSAEADAAADQTGDASSLHIPALHAQVPCTTSPCPVLLCPALPCSTLLCCTHPSREPVPCLPLLQFGLGLCYMRAETLTAHNLLQPVAAVARCAAAVMSAT